MTAVLQAGNHRASCNRVTAVTPARRLTVLPENLVKNQLLAAAVAAALSLGSAAHAASNDELAQIRSQLQSLMQRVDKLEAENNTLKAENDQLKAQTEQVEQTNHAEPPILQPAVPAVKAADWPNRVVVKGDVRYRHQQTDDDSASAKREEDLLRARLGVEAKVNDSIVAGIGIATSSAPGNPRGANVQLDGAFSRKSLYLDLAYFDWTFADNAHFIAGKMKMPFVRPGQSLFWDNDINPEGIALTYSIGSMFGSAWSYWLEENVPATTHGSDHYRHQDVWPAAGQSFRSRRQHSGGRGFVLRPRRGQGRRPFYNGASNGNSLTSTGRSRVRLPGREPDGGVQHQARASCRCRCGPMSRATSTRSTTLRSPWARWSARRRIRGTWETGLAYQLIEKDALFAQHIDSDFGGGLSDCRWLGVAHRLCAGQELGVECDLLQERQQ